MLDTTVLLLSTPLFGALEFVFDGGVTIFAGLIGQADAPAVEGAAQAVEGAAQAVEGAAQAVEGAGGAAAEPEMSPIQRILFGPWVLPLGLFFLFYATFIAPERRRKAEEAKLMAALKKGDRVITIGGIHGSVVSASPESKVVTIKIDESGNTRVKVNRSAIASIVNPNSENKTTKDKD